MKHAQTVAALLLETRERAWRSRPDACHVETRSGTVAGARDFEMQTAHHPSAKPWNDKPNK